MKRIVLFLSLYIVLIPTLVARPQKSITATLSLQPSSDITIVVFTNLFSFDLKHTGNILNEPIDADIVVNTNKAKVAHEPLALTIKKFKSDNKMAQRDFYKLLNADVYPEMFLEVEDLTYTQENGVYVGEVLIDITISDIKRGYKIPIEATIENNILKAKAKKKLSIRDFNLEPPTALMGMIKVSEWIEINLDIESVIDIN